MKLIYVIFKFLLFPGTFVRGVWEHITCKILHLPVESEGYLRPDEACGHVEHALATTPWSAWLMATGPGFMMFNAGMAFLYAGVLNIFYLGVTPYDSLPLFIFYVIMIYLGVSFLCSLFPLTEDILNYWDIRKHFIIVGVFCSLSFCINILIIALIVSDTNIGGLWIGIFVALSFSLFANSIRLFVKNIVKAKDLNMSLVTKIVAFIFSPIITPLALITRAGAFCERNCINFILAAAFIAIHILFVL